MQKKLISMNKPIYFYFDFVSPYSFIAHKLIKRVAQKSSIKIEYRPVLVGGLHNLNGIKAPAFIPSKARFMIRDCKMVAENNKIKFRFNSYFPIKSLNLMRGVFVSAEDNFKSYYIDKVFDAVWQDGLNMNDQNIIDKILKNLGINPTTFSLRTSSQSIKEQLKRKTNEAYELGIFGAPTFLVNNKIFWGQDRLEYALAESLK